MYTDKGPNILFILLSLSTKTGKKSDLSIKIDNE